MRITAIIFCLFSIVIQPANAQKGWFAVDAPFVNLNWMGVDFLNDDFGFVVGEQGRIKRTTNGGSDWEFRQSGVDVTLNAVHVVNENLVFAAGFSGTLVKSTNGGDSWVTVETSGTTATLLGVHFFDEMEGFIAGSQATLHKTTDGGASWVPQNTRFGGNNVWDIHAFDRSNLIISGNGGSVARTTNGGANWRKQSVPFGLEIYSISFSDTANGLCIGESATMMKTTNGGEDWAIHDPGFPLPPLPFKSVSTPDAYHSYICGWNAQILGQWDGNTWEVQKIPAGYSGTHLTGISFPSPEIGYICGWDGTILKTVNGGTLSVELVEFHASVFSLSTLYPNPVSDNREMKAQFSIHTHSDVSISVYNMLGHNVAEIARGEYHPGTYAVTVPSYGLPTGMYVLRLATASGVMNQRFVVHR